MGSNGDKRRDLATLPVDTVVDPRHLRPYRRLRKLLAFERKFQLLFGQFNDSLYRDRLCDELKNTFPATTVIRVGEEEITDFNSLENRLRSAAKGGGLIQVIGLQRWLQPDSARALFKGFNYHREAIAEIKVNLLLWLPEQAIARFTTEAPDMWAWRAAVLDFHVPSFHALDQLERSLEPVHAIGSGGSKKKRHQRIHEIETYLEGSPARPDLLYELAEGYFSLDQYQQFENQLMLAVAVIILMFHG